MIVSMQDRGQGVTGLHIGIANVRRYFRKRTSAVDLELDHLQIRCNLASSFWLDAPEIVDPRLGAWLAAKRANGKVARTPGLLRLLPAGAGRFRLECSAAEETAAAESPPGACC